MRRTRGWDVLTLFQLRGQQELPYRAMTVAYEHHMKCDLTGYPKNVRARAIEHLQQDRRGRRRLRRGDVAPRRTRRTRCRRRPCWPACATIRGAASTQVVVKAFINLLGIYPVGTLVVLDTFELAIVHSANPNPEAVSRPIVRIVSDERGNIAVSRAATCDLTEADVDNAYLRTIIKTENPDRYGINVGDYFV